MARGKTRKVLASDLRTTRKSITRGKGKAPVDDSSTASAPHHGTRSGVRSNHSADPASSITGDPESILRKARKARKARETAQAQARPESPRRRGFDSVVKSIEPSLAEGHRGLDDGAHQEYLDEGLHLQSSDTNSEDTDPEQRFNRKWGYLPPLDEEALAVIDAIIADPSLALQYSKMKPEGDFYREGLRFRNVRLKESPDLDRYIAHFWSLSPKESVSETDEERYSHEQLWTLDQAKCSEGTNEALFQRTVMMSLIARHVFIYDRDNTNQSCLDFSVEEPWNCPSMPTRAYEMNENVLPQPRPDLAVCFRRKAIMADKLWNKLPKATRKLACYESAGDLTEKVFHFFSIEAKGAMFTADDSKGKCQSLNNASQALHNMFEFFRDAGPEHELKFFDQVRFFSAVASAKGITIRIHRAAREDGSVSGFIIRSRPDYPLRFEYRDILTVQSGSFDRKPVLETIKKILIGYGVNELCGLLKGAATAMMETLEEDSARAERQNLDFYRHGQTGSRSRKGTPAANSRKSTPAVRQGRSVANSRVMSADPSIHMARSVSVTPTSSPPPTSMQTASDGSQKRRREQSEDSVSARRSRQRNQ